MGMGGVVEVQAGFESEREAAQVPPPEPAEEAPSESDYESQAEEEYFNELDEALAQAEEEPTGSFVHYYMPPLAREAVGSFFLYSHPRVSSHFIHSPSTVPYYLVLFLLFSSSNFSIPPHV